VYGRGTAVDIPETESERVELREGDSDIVIDVDISVW
jgi:hypothetical protein